MSSTSEPRTRATVSRNFVRIWKRDILDHSDFLSWRLYLVRGRQQVVINELAGELRNDVIGTGVSLRRLIVVIRRRPYYFLVTCVCPTSVQVFPPNCGLSPDKPNLLKGNIWELGYELGYAYEGKEIKLGNNACCV